MLVIRTTTSKKRLKMDSWKKDFQKLESEVNKLMESFEKDYQESELTDDFSEDIREKLENRREGIRLSVKSVSRLLRKLDPEKPLTDVEMDIIKTVEVVNMMNMNREQLIEEVENQEELAEQQEQAIEVKVETENPIEGDSSSPSIPELKRRAY